MSGAGTIDLDWESLTPDLSAKVLELLNASLSSATRPSAIGPIAVTSFEFGSNPPDISLVDIRDIYADFLEDDEEEPEPQPNPTPEPPSEDYEWVSRREGAPSEVGVGSIPFQTSGMPSEALFSRDGASSRYQSPAHNLRAGAYSSAGAHTPALGQSVASFSRGPGASLHRPGYSAANSFVQTGAMPARYPLAAAAGLRSGAQTPYHEGPAFPFPVASVNQAPGSLSPSPSSPTPPKPPRDNGQPDLQLHFKIIFESNMRLGISTSLQINYPSPMIMALPMKMCVTGLVLEGELVVAYEGSRQRVHVCFLDELATHEGGPAPACRSSPEPETDPAVEPESPSAMGSSSFGRAAAGRLSASATASRISSKPAPIGLRLLPSIILETEIGQEDKHVLRNVARVERFIQDVIRKTIEDELVYPNFQTIVMGAAEGAEKEA
ncbi:hypothetical protein DL93DRAFT_1808854 [Clavulina sp. PMI_390]|nr:hypothetical protein DL93DRAFT_1808854 [Clavulina sp. PMI_390]